MSVPPLRYTNFLYDPPSVRTLLASLPHLGATLEPDREGHKAEWFPGLRKSPRQLYRLLAVHPLVRVSR